MENGYIEVASYSGTGLDEDGNPITQVPSYGSQIPSLIKVNKNNKRGKLNGNTFIIASFEIFIEQTEISSEKIKVNYQGTDRGEFSIMEVENLEMVGKTKILV